MKKERVLAEESASFHQTIYGFKIGECTHPHFLDENGLDGAGQIVEIFFDYCFREFRF